MKIEDLNEIINNRIFIILIKSIILSQVQ